ncbi:MAG: AbrB/MazE/SpoVT family DNA-binding domain-containing protein [Candidatus Daviesbacteria bacterium]|nr:AbrB/MazE/SpoVT family DNA-binding domain-containing protein [Candidatus Daviesbacteria bacterium]
MMSFQSTTITQKGQVTIPVDIRRLLHLKTGDQVKFLVDHKKQVKIKLAKKFSIMSLYGSLKPKIHPNLTGQELIKWEKEAWPRAAMERDLKSMQR